MCETGEEDRACVVHRTLVAATRDLGVTAHRLSRMHHGQAEQLLEGIEVAIAVQE